MYRGNNLIIFAPKLYAMVTRETIREIIIDNRQQVAKREIISRNFNFMDNACYVLIGVRRAGKSYLLYQRIQQLIRDGHSWDEIVYINFEDERLLEMQATDLNKILEVHQMMTDKMPLLFFGRNTEHCRMGQVCPSPCRKQIFRHRNGQQCQNAQSRRGYNSRRQIHY